MSKLIFKALWLPILSIFSLQVQAADARIAAAANLRHVLPELLNQYEQVSQQTLAVSYAASGTLATQIEHGAPFDLFLSANPEYVERLEEADLTYGETKNFAQAQMVLFASQFSKLKIEKGLLALAEQLKTGQVSKIAIANPIHAPYGQAAKTMLEQQGLWQSIQPYLIVAENASQAVQFSLTSSVDAGFIPYSHVIQPQTKDKGRFVLLAAELPQQAVLLTADNRVAGEFLNFMLSEQGQAILERHGFLAAH